MRTWTSEIRIGVIAGLTATAVLFAVPRIQSGLRRVAPSERRDLAHPVAWRPSLNDPVSAARSAVARGDAMFLAIADGDSLLLPGVTPDVQRAHMADPMRVFSPRAVGLFGDDWRAFAADAIPYAAAFNAAVQVARADGLRGS